MEKVATPALTPYGSSRKIPYGMCRNPGGAIMAQELPTLGELEIRVLQLVWQEQPCTERQISDLVQKERSVGRTTVLKTMQRLEAKGLLARSEGEGSIRYRAAVDQQRVLPALIGRFVEHVLGGSAEPLVAYLGNLKKLSAKDLEALRAIARKIQGDSNAR
jgi:BlaI family transcriptional regulator, penicillinase repressor